MGSERPLLVFGDDGSRGADVAWLWCNNHRWPGWHVEVVTAADPGWPPTGTASALQDWEPPWGRAFWHPEELGGLRYRTAAVDPRVLLDTRNDADLLVLGTRGLGHLRAVWVGSTAEWLLHHPPAPLAIVRTAAPTREVVVCADGSVHARRAVDAFLALPLAADAAVLVLGVADGRSDVAAGVEEARARLEGRVRSVGVREVTGRPTEAILGVLEDERPDLVVLGTRGLTGLARLRLGSTASAVVRAAACNSLLACEE